MLRALFPQAAFIPKERSLHTAVQLQSAHLHSTIDALIDSGATDNFISLALVHQFRIPIYKLTKPKIICNVDGTANSNGTVTEYAPITILYNDQTTAVRNLLMVPSGTRRLKATAQEVSVNKD
jgi:hypothetical protein